MANRVNIEISANVDAYVQGIDKATDSAEKYTTETRKIADSQVNLMKELKAAKKEVQNLAAGFAKLDDAAKNSEFGKEMARQLQVAKERAAEYIDLQGDLNAELKNMASDTQNLDILSQGMNVFMQATSAATGIVAQFTGNEEDARKAVVAFTTAQSTLNALTQIQNALQKQSSLMLGVTKLQTLAATAAENLNTAAKSKNIVVTKAATIAQAAFNKIAMANPYVLLAAAIIGVVAAFTAFTAASSDAEEKEKEIQEEIEKTNAKLEEQRTSFLNAASNAHSTASRISHLASEYKNCTDEMEKTAILSEAASEFKKLGIEVNSVNDAQRILMEQSGDVIELLKLEGDAAGIAALRMEAFKDSMRKMMENGYDAHVASILAGSNATVLALDKEIDRIKAREAALRKNLKIKDQIFNSGKNKNTVNIDYDKDSLADYENQYNKLQEKLKKKKLSPVDIEQTLREIEDLKKKIEAKKIELGAEPDPKSIEGTIAYYQDQIKKLEDKKARLKIDAYVERQQIQDQIDGLQLKIKLETEGIEKVGSLDVSKALTNNYEKSLSGIDKAISALKKKLNDTDWVNWDGQGTSILELIDKIKKLEEEQQLLQDVQDKLSSSTSSFTETLNTSLDVLSGVHAIDNIVGSFENLSSALSENGNAWEQFMAIIQIVESVMNGINTVTEITNMLTHKSAVSKAADAAASQASTTALTSKAVAEAAGVAPATALSVANNALEKSTLDLAAAQIFAAHASIPFAGVGIASGLVTSMLSAYAAAKLAIISMQAFTQGGIVGGNSYSGDKILARLNSGEMILNKKQQKNLFDLLDQGAMPSSNGTNVTVTGVIRGTDIILVQKNTNKVLNKARNAIKF